MYKTPFRKFGHISHLDFDCFDKHQKCLQNLLSLFLSDDARSLKYAALADQRIELTLLRSVL